MTPDDEPVPTEGAVAGDTWSSHTPSAPAAEGGEAAAGPWPDTGAPESRPKRRWRLVAVAVAVVVLAAAVTGIVVAASSSSSTTSTPAVVGGAGAAARLVQASLAAAEAAGTFHYVSTSTTAGVTQTTVGDAAPDRGRQVITIGTHTFSVLVIGSTAYFQGDAATLESELDLDPLVAQAHAGQWISLVPSDSPYDSVYAAVTTESALDDSVTIAAKAVLSDVTIGRTPVTPVRGVLTPVDQTQVTGTCRLDVRSSKPHLPVRFTGSGSVTDQSGNNQQTTMSVTFGDWGEPVTVDAPSGAVAYSSLQVGGLNPGSGGVVLT